MPTREVALAPEVPVPARACNGKALPRAPAPGGRQAQRSACACRGDLPRPSRRADCSARLTRPTRSRGARAYPPAASTARLDPFGCRRAPAAQELPLASTAE
jgi:hypothetical protein